MELSEIIRGLRSIESEPFFIFFIFFFQGTGGSHSGAIGNYPRAAVDRERDRQGGAGGGRVRAGEAHATDVQLPVSVANVLLMCC